MFGRRRNNVSANGDAKVNVWGGKGNTVNITVNNTVSYTHNSAPLFTVTWKARGGRRVEIPVRARNTDEVAEHMPQIVNAARRRGLPVSNDVSIDQNGNNEPVPNEVNVINGGSK